MFIFSAKMNASAAYKSKGAFHMCDCRILFKDECDCETAKDLRIKMREIEVYLYALEGSHVKTIQKIIDEALGRGVSQGLSY